MVHGFPWFWFHGKSEWRKNSWKSTLWNPIADRKEYNLSSLSVEWIGSISAEDLWSYYNKSSSRGQECSCSSI